MAEKETLVVASKVKSYIKEAGNLKCSAKVIDALSDKIREICDEAIEKAKKTSGKPFRKEIYSKYSCDLIRKRCYWVSKQRFYRIII